MKSSRRNLAALCLALAALAVALVPVGASAAGEAPAWAPLAAAGPTNLAPGSKGTIAAYIQNVGGATSTGAIITLTDILPAGIVTTGTPFPHGGTSPWVCSPGTGQTTIECTTPEKVAPGLTAIAIEIPVEVEAAATTGENTLTVSGGGATSPGIFEAPITISETPAKAGIAALTVGTYNPDGTKTTAAASHPYASDVGVLVNTVRTPNGEAIVPAGDPRTIKVNLPPGFLGNPQATPRCPEGLRDSECPLDTQVGLAAPIATDFGSSPEASGVHSVEAPIGYPAKFTFGIVGDLYQANLLASLRSDEDYGVTVEAPNLAQINPVYGSFASIWGAPASPSHDSQRCVGFGAGVGSECGQGSKEETAFVTMASDCAFQAEEPPFALVAFESWQDPGNFDEKLFAVPSVTDCEPLSLAGAAFSFTPETTAAASPTGVKTELTLPQAGLVEPEALAAPPLRHAEVTFPAGVTLNASAADGLATCSLKQIGYNEASPFPEPNKFHFDKNPANCPDASKVGSLEVETKLLEKPLHGSFYLAAQNENPFGSLLAVYLVIEDPNVGIVIKLPGEVRPDPLTGQLHAIFDDLPPTAVGAVKLSFKGGNRAPLATPDTCGVFTTVSLLTPWSAPESGPPTETTDSFDISGGPNGGPCANSKGARPFHPSFAAGTASTAADTFSPLEFRLSRNDGEGELKGLRITMPRGLTGKIAGVGTCTGAEIAAAEAKSGKAEQASPSCPASSLLGTITSSAGIGPDPIAVTGKLYLSTPYKGAPLSAVAIVPAVAGPYDLGNVVSRAAVRVDPATAQLTATTDPIPDILKGVPVELRSLRVVLDRPGFTLTPTSCERAAIEAKISGANNTTASSSAPFQVGGCEGLAFKPKLTARLKGGTGRGDHPAFSTTLTFPAGGGYTNTRDVQVTLPHSEFLDQAHIRTVCTRVQFAAGQCPPGSIYGHVEATTPLLDQPLAGNVYLRSSDNKLPDIVLVLKGPPSLPVEVVLDGRVDSIKGGIRTTFEDVPDAPVSKVVLRMSGAKKGLLVNSRNLCNGKPARLSVSLVGQNNKRADSSPVLANSCKKHKRHQKHGRRS